MKFDNTYTIRDTLGEGGMAKVYLADVDLDAFNYTLLYAYTQVRGETHADRRVAAEVLAEKLASQTLDSATVRAILEAHNIPLPQLTVALKISKPEGDRARFEGEWRNLLCLNHPNVVKVYGGGEYMNRPYYSMQLLENIVDLQEIDQGFTMQHKIEVILEAARGLGYLHDNGIIHRDVKPGNIITCRGEDGSLITKVTDIGLAKTEDSTIELTTSTAFMGTPCYMPPEQAMSAKDVDRRSDIYSLGGALYRLLCNVPPYHEEETIYAIISAIGNNRPPTPPRKINPKIPQIIEEIIHCAMHYNREDRYQSMAEMAADLELFLLKNEADPAKYSFSRRQEALAARSAKLTQTAPADVLETTVVGPDKKQVLEKAVAPTPQKQEASVPPTDATPVPPPSCNHVDLNVAYSFSTFANDLLKLLPSGVQSNFKTRLRGANSDERRKVIRAMIGALKAEQHKEKALERIRYAYNRGNLQLRVFCIELLQIVLSAPEEVAILQKLIATKDAQVRRWILHRFSELRADDARFLIIKFLRDEASTVRESAAKALEQFNHPDVIEPLLMYYLRTGGRIPNNFLLRLQKQPPASRDKIVQHLTMSEHKAARTLACALLAEIRTQTAYSMLRTLMRDKQPSVRAAAARAAGLNRSEELLEALFQALMDTSAVAQEGVVDGLIQFQLSQPAAVLLSAYGERKSRISKEMVQFLWRMHTDDEALKEMLANPGALPEQEGKLLYLLLKQAFGGQLSLDEVTSLLQNADPEKRAKGIRKTYHAINRRYEMIAKAARKSRADIYNAMQSGL